MNLTKRSTYQILTITTLTMLGIGTIFYHLVEKWSWVDAYYFCVVSLATVGYGDFVPKTDAGKIFTTFYIVAGVGILGAFVNTFVKKRGDKIRHRQEERSKNKA